MTAEKKVILIVEDDFAISSTLREFLEENNFQVLTAGNGREGLEILDSAVRPAVILLDLMMPVMDGFKFRESQLLREDLRDIPVIVMSADGHVEEKKSATSATDYLRKPFDIFHLLATVKKYTKAASAR